jgi:hypothetical protein
MFKEILASESMFKTEQELEAYRKKRAFNILKYKLKKQNELNAIAEYIIASNPNGANNADIRRLEGILAELKKLQNIPLYEEPKKSKYDPQDYDLALINLFQKELWNDNDIKVKLIYNRTTYLHKSINELTVEDILSGFKISGIYYGYSSFNPLWFKKFIEDNNIKICYDPCGGWGHRLLGSQLLEKYIYNDLSIDTYNNVNKIIQDLNIQNAVTYNNDATTFIPIENYDAIFTCPPYYNIEEYSCGKFNSIDDYNKLIDNIFNCFYNKESCKILGIVIREDLLPNKFSNYTNKICLSRKSSSHLNKGNKIYKDYLFIYNK